jgi:hypothetical protein
MILGEAVRDFDGRRRHRLPDFHVLLQGRARARWADFCPRCAPWIRCRRGVHPAGRFDRAGQLAGSRRWEPRAPHCRSSAEHGLTPWPFHSLTICATWWCASTTTMMTALGIALTVAVLLAVLALVNGLRVTLGLRATRATCWCCARADFRAGEPGDARAVSGPEVQARIATGRDGQPLASLEVITIISLEAEGSDTGDNVTIRGLPARGHRDAAQRQSDRGPLVPAGQRTKPWWARAWPIVPDRADREESCAWAAAIGKSSA